MARAKSSTPRAPRLIIDLTADIIRDSKTRDSSHCMIAEAVRAAYPDATKVSVDIQTIRFTDPKKGFRYVYLTPRAAQVAIVRFDQGDLPEPFKFRLGGGQVALAGRRAASRPLSEKEQAQREAARAAVLVNRGSRTADDNDAASEQSLPYACDGVPERVGGKTPPRSLGMRREYGIRGFDKIR